MIASIGSCKFNCHTITTMTAPILAFKNSFSTKRFLMFIRNILNYMYVYGEKFKCDKNITEVQYLYTNNVLKGS